MSQTKITSRKKGHLAFAWMLFSFGAILPSCLDSPPNRREGLFIEQHSQAVRSVCANGQRVRGIDVSKWQGQINWDQVVASGEIKFAIIRVSDGLNTQDEYFDRNWSEAGRVGLIRGVYQYFRPNQDARAQAQLVLDRMGPLGPGMLPPVIDVEGGGNEDVSTATWRASIGEWIDVVEGALGVRPLIYTGGYFWDGNVNSATWTDYPVWVAHWGTDCPNIPNAWSEWAFHQDSDSGRIPGISGNVDTNWYNGTYEALAALANGETPEPEPCGSIPRQGGVIDNLSPCFSLNGPIQFWRTETGGYDNSYRWTNATDYPDPVNSATWQLSVDVAGEYELATYVAAGAAESQQAPYEVVHRDGAQLVSVDQSQSQGWHAMGTYFFNANAMYRVTVNDNSGEANALQMSIVADAIRVLPVSMVPTDMGLEPSPDVGVNPDMGEEPTMPDAGMGEPQDLDSGKIEEDAQRPINPQDSDAMLEGENPQVSLEYQGISACSMMGPLNSKGGGTGLLILCPLLAFAGRARRN